MSVIRECIVNEIRMKLVEFDHKGLPMNDDSNSHRDNLLTMAAIAMYAVEEMDTESLGDKV